MTTTTQPKEDTYTARVQANLAQMGTEAQEWAALPFKIVIGRDGRPFPQTDFPAGYGSAPTLYKPASSSEACCGLCGRPGIKRVFHVVHHGRRWTLPVGSECVLHFGEDSGEDLKKQALWNHNRQVVRELQAGLNAWRAGTYYKPCEQQMVAERLRRILALVKPDAITTPSKYTYQPSTDGAITGWTNRNLAKALDLARRLGFGSATQAGATAATEDSDGPEEPEDVDLRPAGPVA